METENKELEIGNTPQEPVIEENKQEEIKPGESRPKLLSPEEIRKRKKMLVYPLMGLAFVIVMYIIFAPSKKDKEKEQAEQGLNLNIPEVSGGDLLEDKEFAYEQANREQYEQERQAAMGVLSDFFVSEESRDENWEDTSQGGYTDEKPNTIGQSALAYNDIRHTLGNFYEDRFEIEALQQQIDDLQFQLEERNAESTENHEMEQQLALMEKSYEMAARYLPQGNDTSVNPFETAVEREMDEPLYAHTKAEPKEPVLTVYPDVESVVSTLYKQVPDSVFMVEQMQEQNRSFISATETPEDIPDKNTLKVSVYETVTLKDGETVRLRLMESARVANMLIPKNTLLTAVARIQGSRLTLSVTYLEHRERIVAVNLAAYDLDGQPGVFIPNSEEMSAVKEVVAGMGQSEGTSFTFNSSAGQQLAADAGRGLMQGASQLLNKKMREIKVTLKSGHKLLLMQNR